MECRSCRYFTEDRGTWTVTGWTGDGSQGRCHLEPRTVPVTADKSICRHFEAVR